MKNKYNPMYRIHIGLCCRSTYSIINKEDSSRFIKEPTNKNPTIIARLMIMFKNLFFIVLGFK